MARGSAAAAAIPFGRREVLGPHPLDEIVVGGGLDDLVELRAVVGDQAHTFDDDVADAPAVLLARQPVVHRHLVTLLGDDARFHRGLVAVYGLAHVRDLLTLVEVDLADIRRLEEIAEEPDELLALGRRTLLPVRSQRALGRFLEVEETVRDATDLRAP